MNLSGRRPAKTEADYPPVMVTACPLCGVEREATRTGDGRVLFPGRPDLGLNYSYAAPVHDCPERHKVRKSAHMSGNECSECGHLLDQHSAQGCQALGDECDCDKGGPL